MRLPCGLRTESDFVKAMALGADGVAIANSAIQAIGCLGMRACHTNNCPVGIATQRQDLRALLVALALVHALFDVVAALLRTLEARGILSIVVSDPFHPYGARPAAPPHDAAAAEERKRLARDLHDSIKQQLFRIRLGLATVKARWADDPAGARAALDDSERGAEEALVEMNALLQRLAPSPLAKAGLVQALRDQAEALGYRTGMAVHVEFGPLPPDDRLPAGTSEALFRIAQEALSNVARHARADNVWLRLRTDRDEAVVLEVADDGQGFDPRGAAGGMGLTGIHERAEAIGGVDAVLSEPGGGTRVRVAVPMVDPLVAMAQAPAQQLVDALLGQDAALLLAAIAASVWTGAVVLSLAADRLLGLGAWSGWALPAVGVAVGLGIALPCWRYHRRTARRILALAPAPSEAALQLALARRTGWLLGIYGVVGVLTYPGDGPITGWLSALPLSVYVFLVLVVLLGSVHGWWRLYGAQVRSLAEVAAWEPLRAWSRFQYYARHRTSHWIILLLAPLGQLPFWAGIYSRLRQSFLHDIDIPFDHRWFVSYMVLVLSHVCFVVASLAIARHFKRWSVVLRRRYEEAVA